MYFQINQYLHNPAISVDAYTFAPGDSGDDISGVTVTVIPEPTPYSVIAGIGLLAVCLCFKLHCPRN